MLISTDRIACLFVGEKVYAYLCVGEREYDQSLASRNYLYMSAYACPLPAQVYVPPMLAVRRYMFHPEEQLPPFAAVVTLPLVDVEPEVKGKTAANCAAASIIDSS